MEDALLSLEDALQRMLAGVVPLPAIERPVDRILGIGAGPRHHGPVHPAALG